jgi:hypothetical protein
VRVVNARLKCPCPCHRPGSIFNPTEASCKLCKGTGFYKRASLVSMSKTPAPAKKAPKAATKTTAAAKPAAKMTAPATRAMGLKKGKTTAA